MKHARSIRLHLHRRRTSSDWHPRNNRYRAEATARFRYGRRYLERKDRIAIDPVQLPLPGNEVDRNYFVPEDFVLFNGIRDAAPDGWEDI